jgi:protein-tyrosine phosphatase
VALTSVARQFRARDFERFDLVLALDEEIHAGLVALAPSPTAAAKVRYLRAYDPEAGADRDVPDPYYGGPRDFERAYALVARGCRGLLDELIAREGPQAI